MIAGAHCQDQHTNCKSWATAGSCTLSPDPMLTTCPKSCGVCKEVCKDKKSDCLAWADLGYCRRTAKSEVHLIQYMLKNCKKSCGVCTSDIVTKKT